MRFFESDQGVIRFTFAGIPTVIRPSSWLMLLLLGSLNQSAASINVAGVLLFVVAGMLCLLVHEYGHALTCRAMGGGASSIEITSMGGLTSSDILPSGRFGQLLMVLAGPGASLALCLLGGMLLGLQVGNVRAGMLFSLYMPLAGLLPHTVMAPDELLVLLPIIFNGEMSNFVITGYCSLFTVCVWWALFNLLPIIPLDGSKALHLIINNALLVCRIGVVVSVLLMVVCLTRAMVFNAFICASLAYTNWQYLKPTRK